MNWGRQRKIVFTDKENESMQSIIYEQDVDQLNKLLELYKTYYVGNAKIKEITGKTPILGTSKHQMILSRSTYIRSAEEHKQLPIDHVYQLTPFARFPEMADILHIGKSIYFAVLYTSSHHDLLKELKETYKILWLSTKSKLFCSKAQTFSYYNLMFLPLILIVKIHFYYAYRRRASILTLLEEFLQTEAPYLTKNVHNMPIILGMRLSVNTFYGLSIGTTPSTILFGLW
ncbi:uncharacterized protein [Primulina eburnea]|uniref:uncharacterized protein n=1 Tax=Primulina eburnea TaxID=1245227 RepID=UPI003C6BE76A